jgi:hypothetical protein
VLIRIAIAASDDLRRSEREHLEFFYQHSENQPSNHIPINDIMFVVPQLIERQ